MTDRIALQPGASQVEQLLAWFQATPDISPFEAMGNLSIQRLAARILELRQMGYDIRTELKASPTGKRYTRYFFKGRVGR